MIPDPECQTWREYGDKMSSKRDREWNELSPQKKEAILVQLNEILGSGWEERVRK